MGTNCSTGEELAYLGSEPAREARTAPLPDELDPRVRDALEARGIDSLYSHQAEAWEAAARGENFVVTTGTASGKSLAFNLPVLAALAEEPKQRALYLYPTKALAQDQVRALDELKVPARPARDLRRRHRERAPLADPQVVEPDPDEPGHAPRRRPARTTTAGATCSRTSASSSSTRPTSTAASSARTSATCCGASGGSPASTDRIRSSCSRRRRSATPVSSPTRSSGSTSP